jgi:CRISPR/Cas system-associated exonuclease Cas4 (RecB family)
MTLQFDPIVLEFAPWSVSKYQTLDKCAKQFHGRYVAKLPSAPEDTSAKIGTAAHGVLETCLKDNSPTTDKIVSSYNDQLTTQEKQAVDLLVPSIDKFVKRIAKFEKNKNIIARGIEEELAIDKNFNFVEYRSKDAFMRGKIDYSAITEEGSAIVGDHKTGKFKRVEEHFLQLNTYMLLMVAKYPNIQSVQAFIHYLGREDLEWTPVMSKTKITQELRPWLVQTLNRYAARLKALKNETIAPSTGWWCEYCGYRDTCNEGLVEIKRRVSKRNSTNI